jgi:uncharacterized membrane protein YedE/YeeE
MPHILPERIPWFVAGPLIGLLVVAMYALANVPLGISGAYVEVATFLRRRPSALRWRVWYFVGLVAGAALAAALRGGLAFDPGYAALGRAVPPAALPPLLLTAGALMGYGARWAGGCTSGHGLCGTSVRSPGSFIATVTFMGTAIGVTEILHILSGGTL